jgi:hypothetical protein
MKKLTRRHHFGSSVNTTHCNISPLRGKSPAALTKEDHVATRPNRYSTLTWRKSSASAGAGECVEVATSDPYVLTRDSRDQSGAVLEFTSAQWCGLVSRIKNGEADRG